MSDYYKHDHSHHHGGYDDNWHRHPHSHREDQPTANGAAHKHAHGDRPAFGYAERGSGGRCPRILYMGRCIKAAGHSGGHSA